MREEPTSVWSRFDLIFGIKSGKTVNLKSAHKNPVSYFLMWTSRFQMAGNYSENSKMYSYIFGLMSANFAQLHLTFNLYQPILFT
jgi:hypothetical protein